jgi:hypothetical protein
VLVENGIATHRYEEEVRAGRPRLGRHLVLDARSLAYTVERELQDLGGAIPIEPQEWLSPVPVLDQGQLGSCTGNAGTYALAALYGQDDLADVSLGVLGGEVWRLGADAGADEQFAVELYHLATVDDGFPGTYPPDDTGSSGLGVCRALRAAHLVNRYAWATTLRGFGSALQRGGVMVGTPWLNAWFEPGPDGFVDADPSWLNSGVAGGHEVYVEALEAWDDHDPSKSVVRFRNSWGPAWGDHGSGRMRLSTYVALRQQIDVKQLSRRA